MTIVVPKLRYRIGQKCPSCNSTDKPKKGKLFLRRSKFGKFLGCSLYPECRFVGKLDNKNVRFKKKKRAQNLFLKEVYRERVAQQQFLKTI